MDGTKQRTKTKHKNEKDRVKHENTTVNMKRERQHRMEWNEINNNKKITSMKMYPGPVGYYLVTGVAM